MLKSFVEYSTKKAIEIAEKKFQAHDLEGAIEYATLAKKINPSMKHIDATLIAYNIHMMASKKNTNGEPNWYKVLGVTNIFANLETIKKQYKKIAIVVHPDKNCSVAAEGAFKIITQAWDVLSDPSKHKANAFKSGFCPSNHAKSSPARARTRTRTKPATSSSAQGHSDTQKVACGKIMKKKKCPRCGRWCKYENPKGPSRCKHGDAECSSIMCPNCKNRFDPQTSLISEDWCQSRRIKRNTDLHPLFI